jgi:hypothetical protein
MAETPKVDPQRRRLLLLARSRHLLNLAFAVVFAGSAYVLRSTELDRWARLCVALTPALPLAAVIATYAILVRKRCFDEFGRRVLLEACATVFIVGMPILLVYAMLRNAWIGVGELGWEPVFMVSFGLFLLGVILSLKRNQGYVNWTSRGVPGGRGGGGGGGS